MLDRRRIILGAVALMLCHTPASAQATWTDRLVAQLESDGYTVTEVRRSWLGRIVVTASKGDYLREVVLNRSSGEVLRDQYFLVAPPTISDAPAATGSSDQENTGASSPTAPRRPSGQGANRPAPPRDSNGPRRPPKRDGGRGPGGRP